jgi:protein-disulfide isomerase
MRLAIALAVLAPLPLGATAGAKTAAKAPAAVHDWTRVVAATPEGGFRLGNPNAKVKLVEYGSLTCPHCRAFDEEGVPTLLGKYVKNGQVSWEFRNYVRDGFDLTAALIVRCNGARSFFPLMRAVYKTQPDWFGRKAVGAPQAELERLQNLPPEQQFIASAKLAGLLDWAAARGLPAAKSNQCLSNPAAIKQLIEMTRNTTIQYPAFAGTPTFVINGKVTENAATWQTLEPQLQRALGG